MSVGLDIGSKTIKVVELSPEGTSWRLRASGIVGYKGIAPDQVKEEKELAPLVDVIKKLYKEAKITSRDVSIALSESSVYTRIVKFPMLTDNEIASAVRWEAEQYIPIPAAEAIIQHQIIERRENTSPPSVDVLLVAAPRLVVERYVRAVEIYKSDCSRYPTTLTFSGTLVGDGTNCPAANTYMQLVPQDSVSGRVYGYKTSGTPPTTYTICAALEDVTTVDARCSGVSCGTGTCSYSVTSP